MKNVIVFVLMVFTSIGFAQEIKTTDLGGLKMVKIERSGLDFLDMSLKAIELVDNLEVNYGDMKYTFDLGKTLSTGNGQLFDEMFAGIESDVVYFSENQDSCNVDGSLKEKDGKLSLNIDVYITKEKYGNDGTHQRTYEKEEIKKCVLDRIKAISNVLKNKVTTYAIILDSQSLPKNLELNANRESGKGGIPEYHFDYDKTISPEINKQ